MTSLNTCWSSNFITSAAIFRMNHAFEKNELSITIPDSEEVLPHIHRLDIEWNIKAASRLWRVFPACNDLKV